MVQIVPVGVRNSGTGKIWYASALVYGILGRGDTPEEALNSLMEHMKEVLPDETLEFRVRSVDVNFPTAKSVPEFFAWMESIQKVETSNAV